MRVRIDLGYDGGGFHGWARQPGLRTVQGDLERALDTVLRVEGTSLTVAGRTDAGVHARSQVAHVDLADTAEIGPLVRRLNGLLDADVRVHRISVAPPGFDARFSAVWRRYAYRIADRPDAVDPLRRGHVLVWPRPLDDAAMTRAAEAMLGEHDFAAFCRKRAGATTIRTLIDLGWQRQPDGVLVATVRADAFCHNMVRALVGCLVAVGEGRRDAAWARGVLTGRQRDPAVKVARPHGLTLEEVGYPDDEELALQAERSRVVRTLG